MLRIRIRCIPLPVFDARNLKTGRGYFQCIYTGNRVHEPGTGIPYRYTVLWIRINFCSDSDPEIFLPFSDSVSDSKTNTGILTRQFSKEWLSLRLYVFRNL
jgi:hypothetical protein